MNKQQFIITTLIGIAIYLISTGLSFVAFSATRFSGSPTGPSLTTTTPTGPQAHFRVDPSIPKTEICPLNGALFTKQEKEVWITRRPLAVMIENHQEARPQSGLSFADIVYESVVEGGITRFEAIFYCNIAASNVNLAPVRSARTFYLPWVLEYDAVYNHVGGAGNCNDDTVDDRAKALCQIDQYKIKDMDQFGISFPTCYRNPDRLDHPVATEHSMVCSTDKLMTLAEKRGWTNVDSKNIPWDKNFVSWKFKDDAKEADRGASFSASFTAWKGYEQDYGVRWEYEKSTNTYLRFNGGVAHKDLESGDQLRAKVIAILFAKETGPVDDHGHLLYANIGSGDALVFQDGKVMKAIWKKPTRTDRTIFYELTGKEIQFNKGQIWIEMLPTGTKVSY